MTSDPRTRLLLWISQGFGTGRCPVGPGTCGSLVGLLWFVLLLSPGQPWLYLAGTAIGLACAVPICGVAENALRQTDPPSVVLDEIVAVPLCFLGWTVGDWLRCGQLPTPATFFSGAAWLPTAALFLLFRGLDIFKPWPIRQAQKLPGGWGITADDLLAAVYVNLVSAVFLAACRSADHPAPIQP